MGLSQTNRAGALRIGVVGAGTMGRGIVQLFAQAGHALLCFDEKPDAAAQGLTAVFSTLESLVAKGRLTSDALQSIRSRASICSSLADLAGCDVVIEAIIEDIAIKRDLFARLEDVVAEGCLLATNTSSLIVAEIASACRRPERVAGLHFFNPVPLMKVAEVIAAVRTAPSAVATLRAIVEGAGHKAVVVADQPGFLVNHAGRGLYTEGLRIVEECVASPSDVDDVLRDGLGFRMGPFELLDLTGLDVSSKVMTSIYEQFQEEPRFRPSSLVPPRVAAGLYGRKTGEGWYRYEKGQKVEPARKSAPSLPSGLSVWIDPDAPESGALAEIVQKSGARRRLQASGSDICFIQPIGEDATSTALRLGIDPIRCVAVDPITPLDRRKTLMLTVVTAQEVRDAAHALLASDGVPVTIIGDSIGFVAQRVIATIVNIAANIAQRAIADVEDLEAAVRIGLGYPFGPLHWGDRIGAARILQILNGQLRSTGDPRYRPSPWIARRAALGVSLLTPEAPR
ncbi:3-hydroxyacyl-CoA dehydrogenase [Bradyrhizobium manausense]|uniref:3-hydroxyacyl-CoA dehydrogenase n=1 Tax=Bradyrhizobium manausense TaxID=989370 RepID=UPI001BA453B6|nr:3-hydroxyacyl-CoA dehydrogenase [Bradyrhizobium manausense]MBR0687737.1 3-hydroxyacyl-CoA dehydrogenase [Bradyrhizobium manausense]